MRGGGWGAGIGPRMPGMSNCCRENRVPRLVILIMLIYAYLACSLHWQLALEPGLLAQEPQQGH